MSPTEKTSSRTIGIRYLGATILVLVVGLFLTATKPVWLAPPLFGYTPLVYVALAYAWLPLFYFTLKHLMERSRGLILALLLLLACGQWFCWASIAPRKQVVEFVGDVSVFAQRHCEYVSPEPGQTHYVCQLRVGSSDDPAERVLRQRFRVWDGVPFMWLIESDFWVE